MYWQQALYPATDHGACRRSSARPALQLAGGYGNEPKYTRFTAWREPLASSDLDWDVSGSRNMWRHLIASVHRAAAIQDRYHRLLIPTGRRISSGEAVPFCRRRRMSV
jgi:hypothetical protein